MSAGPSKRDDMYLQTLAQHSNKIYDFFGFTPGNTPPLNRIIDGKSNDTNLHRIDTSTTAGATNGPVDGHAINGAAKGPPGAVSTLLKAKPPPPPLLPLPPPKAKPPSPPPKSNRRGLFRSLVQDFGSIWCVARFPPQTDQH